MVREDPEPRKRCPRCRRIKDASWDYCEIDGSKLEDDPHVVHPLSATHLARCPRCATFYDVYFTFCPSDGSTLMTVPREPVPWEELPLCTSGNPDPRRRMIGGMPIEPPDGVQTLRVCDPYPCWYYRDDHGNIGGIPLTRMRLEL